MKKFTNYAKGFTLIELLVVIAIIGILASVVLVSLNSARNKGKGVRNQAEGAQIRTELESRYDGSVYPINAAVAGEDTYTSAPWSTAGDNLKTLRDDIIANGGLLKVYSSGSKKDYAIYVVFSTQSSIGGACIDSTGNTKTYSSGTAFTSTSNSATCAANL